jgi:hypothetical protein
MAKPKLDPDALRQFMDAGHTQADAARHFGVSHPAIHQRLKKRRILTSRVVAMEKAGQVVEEKLSATARLENIQRVIDGELAYAVEQTRQDGVDRAALADSGGVVGSPMALPGIFLGPTVAIVVEVGAILSAAYCAGESLGDSIYQMYAR